MDGTELIEANPVLVQVLRDRGVYSDDLMRKIAQGGYAQELHGNTGEYKKGVRQRSGYNA